MIKIKTIFFDFDGVLAESVSVKTEAFRVMYLSYGEAFSKKVVQHHISNGGVSRFEKFKIYNGEWLGESVDSQKMNELSKCFSNLVVKGVIESEEVKGTSVFLKNAKSLKKYIITGTPTIEIKPILESRGMDQFFVNAYGSPEKKEYWVAQIMKNENLLKEECVFIGDALADFKAAKLNDILFILRETESAKELFSNFEGYRIKDLTELNQIIKKINQDISNVN